MPMLIIKRFEIVHIQEHQCAITATAFAGGHGLVQPVIQHAAIGQLRQCVIERQISNLLLGLFALGDVTGYDDYTRCLALTVSDQPAAGFHVADTAIRQHEAVLDLQSGPRSNSFLEERSVAHRPESKLLSFHEDTLGGITTVVQAPDSSVPGRQGAAGAGFRTLLTNGKFQASDGGEMDAQTGFVIVPLLHVVERRDALVIGLGSGHSATSAVRRFGFPSIDIAEISPGIVAAARQQFPHINGCILDQPGVHLHLDDGRNLLLLSPKRYDLITMEISSIWFSGSTSLYSRASTNCAAAGSSPGVSCSSGSRSTTSGSRNSAPLS